MTKKLKSAEIVSKVVTAFKCPICNSSMRVIDHKSLICSQNHTYDFTKQGYVNLLTHQTNSHYDKQLFEARQKIIMESNLYLPMHQAITKVIKEHADFSIDPFMMVDLGCGEGSHLQSILNECHMPSMIGVGLDISKEGIMMAAKSYETPIWLVGDLAKSPLQDGAYQVILNILSPSNYNEFKRVLSSNGLVIKVVPHSHYLKELRETLFVGSEKKNYQNDKTVDLFKEHYQLLDQIHLNYTKTLHTDELHNLVQMTPLAWSSEQSDQQAFTNRDFGEITVDLEILVGVKKDS